MVDGPAPVESTATCREQVLAGELFDRRQFLAAGLVTVLWPGGAYAASVLSDKVPTTWDLTELYAGPDAWEAERQRVLLAIAALPPLEQAITSSANTLPDTLLQVSAATRTVAKLGTYANLVADTDLRSAEAQARQALALDLDANLVQAIAWLKPAIARMGRPAVDKLAAAEPRLSQFRTFLSDVFREVAHTPTAEVQATLSAAEKSLLAPSTIYKQLSDIFPVATQTTLADGRSVRVDAQSLRTEARAASPEDRKRMYDAYWSGFGAAEEVFGATLKASVEADGFRARARGYPGSLAAALDRSNIPEAVYRTALAETTRGLPVLHRYYNLRRRLLGLPVFRLSDRVAPVIAYDRRFSLEDMRTLMLAAVAPLGRSYVDKLASATLDRWMDPYPRAGKVPRNYTERGAYDVHPYLLLDLADGYPDLTLFTHEWGHAMHTVLANAAQPYPSSEYPVLVAEVASTCNEQLLVRHMIAEAKTRNEKLFYLAQQLQVLSVVFFNNALMAEFEDQVHSAVEKGDALSGAEMTKRYLLLMQRYYGPDVPIELPYARDWMRAPQFYDAYYNWQYIPCIAGAVHFSSAILGGGAPERSRYLSALQAGGSDYGYRTLLTAGLDLASPAPYRRLVELFSQTIEQTEALLPG